MKKRLLFLPIALLLVFSMVACNTATPEEPIVEEPEPEVEEPIVEEPEVVDPAEDEEAASYEEMVLTPMEAFDTYEKLYPDYMVTSLEVDKYFGAYIYKVEGYKDNEEIEIKINSVNGDIIDTETDVDADLDRDPGITLANVEKIQALLDAAVLDAGAGAKVDEWTLEWDDGVLELDIDVNLDGIGDIDYTYNLESGELIEKD